MRKDLKLASLSVLLLGAGCVASVEPSHRRPAEEYASRVKSDYARRDPEYAAKLRREQGFASATAPGLDELGCGDACCASEVEEADVVVVEPGEAG